MPSFSPSSTQASNKILVTSGDKLPKPHSLSDFVFPSSEAGLLQMEDNADFDIASLLNDDDVPFATRRPAGDDFLAAVMPWCVRVGKGYLLVGLRNFVIPGAVEVTLKLISPSIQSNTSMWHDAMQVGRLPLLPIPSDQPSAAARDRPQSASAMHRSPLIIIITIHAPTAAAAAAAAAIGGGHGACCCWALQGIPSLPSSSPTLVCCSSSSSGRDSRRWHRRQYWAGLPAQPSPL